MQALSTITRVYLIEDDTDDCQIFTEAIKEISTQIILECSNDCLHVLGKLETFVPELIFLDLHLPKKGGLECLSEIHDTIALRNIPVVMYTGSISPIDIDKSAAMGAKLYFEKPSSYRELVVQLRHVLSRDWHTPEALQPMVFKGGEFTPLQAYLKSNKQL
ncbi:MAG: hypothetical protein JWP88_1429 [Flaviaesturariibacter sp.]|nr:hypothetical protein [Flaviaesturariibacter sp.]